MPRKVRLGQLDSHGETLHADDDARRLLRDCVLPAPRVGVEHAGAAGPEGDAEERGERWLGEMQPVADEVREEGVED